MRLAKIHDFQADLQAANDPVYDELWECIYRSTLPAFESMQSLKDNQSMQRLGVDRSVMLSFHRRIFIEEKLRFVNYGDIFLEILHIPYDGNTPWVGWMEKDSAADFLGYAIVPDWIGYLFPWQPLRAAWLYNREIWLKEYPTKDSPNATYISRGVCIPPGIIWQAIAHSQSVHIKLEL